MRLNEYIWQMRGENSQAFWHIKLSSLHFIPVHFSERNSLILFPRHLLLQHVTADHMLVRLHRLPIKNCAIPNKQIQHQEILIALCTVIIFPYLQQWTLITI